MINNLEDIKNSRPTRDDLLYVLNAIKLINELGLEVPQTTKDRLLGLLDELKDLEEVPNVKFS